MKHLFFILFGAAFLAVVNVSADTKVPYTSKPIKIDGHFIHLHDQDKHLGESIWRKAAKINGLHLTKVYALHDENYLYLGFLCGGEEQGEAKAETRTRDNLAMWKDSCVEVFLKVNDRQYQFMFTHVGAVSDLMNHDAKFDFDIKAHSIWDQWDWKNWYLEVALPIAEIDPGRKSSTWNFNICRSIWQNGKMKSVSIVPRGTYKRLSMSGEYGDSEGISFSSPPMELSPGVHKTKLKIENPKRIKGTVKIITETESTSGTILREESSVKLQGNKVESAGIKYAFGKDYGSTRATVRLVNPDNLILASETCYYQKEKPPELAAFLDSTTYFSNDKQATLKMILDSEKLGASTDQVNLNVQITPFGSKIPIYKTEHACTQKQLSVSLPLSKLNPGNYQVFTKITNKKTGKVLSESENRFRKRSDSL